MEAGGEGEAVTSNDEKFGSSIVWHDTGPDHVAEPDRGTESTTRCRADPVSV